ncbi:hypothetical protein [Mucilaginibacter arboris]|uniref:Outer membrane protein beta-barrel domain-containing protein n=1 Tax=Mucilaginibacter arboris TaxID=2682090 RepID=A0A7K1SU89_9SPHI|nr:hypothetical protein [Mucilaginibacter arboris]MVN20902.1 hypothetical protein [Mucilaginibacter arboris]
MKKIYVVLMLLAVLFISSQVRAQQTFDSGTGRAQNVFVELYGQGLLFSANYDTRFSNKRDGIGGRVGIGYFAVDGNNLTTIPIGLNYLLGKGRNFFEVGLGATYLSAKLSGDDFFKSDNSDVTGSEIIGTMSFSYRLQPINSGFALRAGFSPIFGNGFFIPYFPNFSLGYTFSGKHK